MRDPGDYGSDENGWLDGDVAHHCGFHIEDHTLSEEKDSRGRRKWQCPSVSSVTEPKEQS